MQYTQKNINFRSQISSKITTNLNRGEVLMLEWLLHHRFLSRDSLSPVATPLLPPPSCCWPSHRNRVSELGRLRSPFMTSDRGLKMLLRPSPMQLTTESSSVIEPSFPNRFLRRVRKISNPSRFSKTESTPTRLRQRPVRQLLLRPVPALLPAGSWNGSLSPIPEMKQPLRDRITYEFAVRHQVS